VYNVESRILAAQKNIRMSANTILKDFSVKGASSTVSVSEDGNFLLVTGGYPPEASIFDVSALSVKVVRRLTHAIIEGCFLSEDYRKAAFLCTDRYIEFHAQYGKHHHIRLPKFGRSMQYDRATAELFVASSGDSVYRVDLQDGVLVSPLVSRQDGSEHTSLCLAPCGLPLLIAGLDNGVIECWDTREDSKPIASHTVSSDGNEVRRIAISRDSMQIACGLDNGVVRGYDIRSSHVLFERDHRNDFPVVGLHYVSRSVLASADHRSVKIWDITDSSSSVVAFVESEDKLNGLTFWPDSGLFFTPCEGAKVGTHFVPEVGPAPRWCSYLDTLTHEPSLDATPGQPAGDHLFVTREQLQALGAEKLIGTSVVQAYMHGFWIDRKVHAKLRDVAEPFHYEKYQQEKIRTELENSRPMRMPVRVVPTTSKKLINERLQQELVEKMNQIDSKKSNVAASNILEDARFAKLWSNVDFEVEEVRKSQEQDAFAQIGQEQVERIDLKAVNKMAKKSKRKTQ
jgi:ribosome biogenesis protein ENP2